MPNTIKLAAIVASMLLLFGCNREKYSPESKSGAEQKASSREPASSRPVIDKTDRESRKVALAERINSLFDQRHLPDKGKEFTEALLELAKIDPVEAMRIFDPAKMVGRQVGFHELADFLASNHPEVLESWLTDNAPKCELSAQGSCLQSGLLALSLQNPERTADLAFKIPYNASLKGILLVSIFDSFSQREPERAYAKLSQMGLSGSDLDSALDIIVGGALTKNPDLARSIVSKIQNAGSRSFAIGRIVGNDLENGRTEAARLQIEKTSNEEIRLLLSRNPSSPASFLKELAASAPELLATQLGRIVANQANRDVFEQSIRELALKRPELAEGIISSLPESPMKAGLVGSQFEVLAKADVAKSLEKAGTLSNPAQQGEAYQKVGSIAGLQGFDSVMTAASNIPAEQKGNFLAAAMIPSMSLDVGKVASFLLDAEASSALSPEQRANLISRAGGPLAMNSAAAASEWMLKLPEADRTAAMNGIARQMVRGNVLDLSNMLSNMPHDQVWETGVRVLIEDLNQSDPEMAEKWRQLLPKEQNPN